MNKNEKKNNSQKSNSQQIQSQHEFLLAEPLLPDSQVSEEYEPIPWINIDNYTFNLLGKCELGSRLLVLIKSVNIDDETDTHEFMVYTSLSEGGIFRHCIEAEDKHYFIKGHDYVTETFIHMELQKGIIMNLDWIPYMFLNKCTSDLELFRLYKTRLVDIEALQPIRLCPSGYALKPECLLYLAGNKNPKIYQKLYHCLSTYGCPQEPNEKYLEELHSFIEKGELYIEGVKKDEVYDRVLKDVSLYIFDLFDMVLEGLNKYLEKYIKLSDEPPVKIFSWKNEPLFDIILHSNYYSINITIEDKPYILYFNHYFLENNRKTPKYVKSNLIITNIVPLETTINKYGVYNKIVSVGFLIYKPFEYPKQSNVGNVFSETEYKYIGDYMGKLHPINKIYYKYMDILNKNSITPS